MQCSTQNNYIFALRQVMYSGNQKSVNTRISSLFSVIVRVTVAMKRTVLLVTVTGDSTT